MNSNEVMPFIFARLTEESQKSLKHGGQPHVRDWIVMIAQADFKIYDCGWMVNDELGFDCLIPDVDIAVEEDRIFPDFKSARAFVKEWWKNN